MAKKPETRLKERFLRAVRQLPHSHFEKIQQVAIRGTPDIIGCVNGCCCAFELKRSESARIDALQEYNLERWSRAGALAAIVTPENIQEILELLVRISRGEHIHDE